jgi:peptidoglycan/LPS O-acetylase OafA/YrhL
MIHRHHSRPARVARLLPVLAVSVLLSACASPRAYPPPSSDVKAELTALGPYLQPSVLTHTTRHTRGTVEASRHGRGAMSS